MAEEFLVCSERYHPSLGPGSRFEIRESTALPSCLADIISGYAGTWTVDFLLLLPEEVQNRYSTIATADRIPSRRWPVAQRLQWMALLPISEFRLLRPVALSARASGNDAIHRQRVHLGSTSRAGARTMRVGKRQNRGETSDAAPGSTAIAGIIIVQ